MNVFNWITNGLSAVTAAMSTAPPEQWADGRVVAVAASTFLIGALQARRTQRENASREQVIASIREGLDDLESRMAADEVHRAMFTAELKESLGRELANVAWSIEECQGRIEDLDMSVGNILLRLSEVERFVHTHARVDVALNSLVERSFIDFSLPEQSHIHEILNDRFNMEQLNVLAERCGVDWDNLPGQTKERKALELIKEARNSGCSARLLEEIERKRPGLLGLNKRVAEDEIAQPRTFLAKLSTISGDLFGRDDEIKTLDVAWKKPQTHVVVVSAWGGVGKTALVNHWLNRLEQEQYRGAACVYGWSFYSQGTREDRQASGDTFLADALKWFGDPDPNQGAPWDKGVRLAGLVRKQRTLLILDGLEPLQYPPGAMQGRLRDQGVEALLKELARAGTDWGLCVVTTRVPVPELEEMKRASVQSMPLENLSDEAGAHVLRNLGVIHGTERELRETSRDFKDHALALTLLGRYLAVVHDGEIRKRDLVPALEEEEEKGGHAFRVMRSYAIWLEGKPEVDILHLLGLFDRPADGGAIQALREEPVIDGLTNALHGLSEAKWQYAVQRLRDLRLLDGKDDACPDTLDCHPLVREHFGAVLSVQYPTAWKEAHSRLYEHYKGLPEKLYGKFLPDTIEEMEPLFRAVTHGCQAGRHQETLDEVYNPRIKRGRGQYSTSKLGAFGADLAALSGFFDAPWHKPAAGLTDDAKAVLLSWAGYRLRALGRLREAREQMEIAAQMLVGQDDWSQTARNAANLCGLSLTLGDVQAAVDYARQSVDFADRSSGGSFEQCVVRTALADVLHHAGDLPEAERLFREAESLQQKRQPEYPFLYSHRGYQFCDLLLSQGQFRQVQERAGRTLELVTEHNWLLGIALDHLSLGRAAWLQGQTEGADAFPEAARYLNQAVQGLREAGSQHHLPRGLLARAALYRVTGAWADAGRDLAEVQEVAERGDMRLFLADYHLESARLFHAVAQASRLPESAQAAEAFLRSLPEEFGTLLVATTGSDRTAPESSGPQESLSPTAFALTTAREHLATAKEMVARMGYGRRNPEVEELERLLAAE